MNPPVLMRMQTIKLIIQTMNYFKEMKVLEFLTSKDMPHARIKMPSATMSQLTRILGLEEKI